MKILIMDDDPSLRYMLNEIFTYVGWHTVTYSNGREGIKGFLRDGADIILVDYHMPEMDGLETVRIIREHNEHIPILVLTVDERQEIADRFLDEGATDFALKHSLPDVEKLPYLYEGATDFALKPVKAPDLIARVQLHKRLLDMTKADELFPKMHYEAFVTKGISKSTLTYIVEFLKACDEPAAGEEIALKLGLAPPTVYRYMTYLINEEKVRPFMSYQKRGRPKNRYNWIKSET